MDAIAERVEQRPCELIYIPRENIADAWPMIEPYVPTIIERSRGRVSLETLTVKISEGKQHVWTVWDGTEVLALVGLEIGHAPTGLKIATVNFCSGKDSPRWLHLMDELMDRAREIGCQKMEMWARKGWEKKFPEFKLTHVLLEVDL
jgi:hypothetical protein